MNSNTVASAVTSRHDKKTHSAQFDDVAVALSCHIVQPLLKQLAHHVQASALQEQDLATDSSQTKQTAQSTQTKQSEFKTHSIAPIAPIASVTKDSSIIHLADKSSVSGEKDAHQASQILQHLYATPNADASVLVAITNEAHPKLMLTRRASHLKSHAGEVSFAGGKHEADDGNNVVTALREACEETALPPSRVQIVGQLPPQTSKAGMSVRPIVALVDPDVVYVPELGEIERIFWADFATLITQPTIDYEMVYKQGNQPIKFLTPGWEVDNEMVWGLTGRIIASLLHIGFERKVPWYYTPIS